MNISDKSVGKDGLVADEGFFFGLGAFETIAVEQGKPMLISTG